MQKKLPYLRSIHTLLYILIVPVPPVRLVGGTGLAAGVGDDILLVHMCVFRRHACSDVKPDLAAIASEYSVVFCKIDATFPVGD